LGNDSTKGKKEMKYVGSKNRHAKEFLPIILENRKKDQWYIEPFVGGANVIDKVTGKRAGNDKHFYLIELLKAVRDGWQPPRVIGYQEYKNIQKQPSIYPPALTGFVLFCCSYSGKWSGGYARGFDKKGNPRNYADEARRNLLKQAPALQGVLFGNYNYFDIVIPPESIIYCDPPYQNTTKYKDEIDYSLFWQWVRNLSSVGHSVFVSEYSAPDDFREVWSKKVNNTLDKNTGGKQGVERLFKWRGY
jgi:DNA adenine methylase